MWWGIKRRKGRLSISHAKDVGFSSPERGSGVTLNGGETNDMLSMNPEGAEVDVPQGGQMTMPAEPLV